MNSGLLPKHDRGFSEFMPHLPYNVNNNSNNTSNSVDYGLFEVSRSTSGPFRTNTINRMRTPMRNSDSAEMRENSSMEDIHHLILPPTNRELTSGHRLPSEEEVLQNDYNDDEEEDEEEDDDDDDGYDSDADSDDDEEEEEEEDVYSQNWSCDIISRMLSLSLQDGMVSPLTPSLAAAEEGAILPDGLFATGFLSREERRHGRSSNSYINNTINTTTTTTNNNNKNKNNKNNRNKNKNSYCNDNNSNNGSRMSVTLCLNNAIGEDGRLITRRSITLQPREGLRVEIPEENKEEYQRALHSVFQQNTNNEKNKINSNRANNSTNNIQRRDSIASNTKVLDGEAKSKGRKRSVTLILPPAEPREPNNNTKSGAFKFINSKILSEASVTERQKEQEDKRQKSVDVKKTRRSRNDENQQLEREELEETARQELYSHSQRRKYPKRKIPQVSQSQSQSQSQQQQQQEQQQQEKYKHVESPLTLEYQGVPESVNPNEFVYFKTTDKQDFTFQRIDTRMSATSEAGVNVPNVLLPQERDRASIRNSKAPKFTSEEEKKENKKKKGFFDKFICA
ncbi:hypothetical protein LSM04_000102 [Trypanosoma melophagium]|uniref:uncharacterized protein n=1 Tax=Trypanosoma melophagium TaxID=715481 RepID=UPI00351A2E82|nr:hypothetical protein LSM04_000102 [Trypanosoma melophagium]